MNYCYYFQPKPSSRRKVQIAEEEIVPHEDPSQTNAVDNTVAEVISGFMPNMSESISSVQGGKLFIKTHFNCTGR